MASKSNSLSSLSEHIASDQRTKQPAAHGNVKLLNLANGENGPKLWGENAEFRQETVSFGEIKDSLCLHWVTFYTFSIIVVLLMIFFFLTGNA